MVRYLYLIRHGQYDTSDASEHGGHLTELGCRQAQRTADAIAHIPVNMIYCSTMVRAVETAEIIADVFDNSTPVANDLLREALPSIPPRYAAEILERMANDPQLSHAQIHENGKRFDSAFDTFFQPVDTMTDQHDLIVCHGNITRYFICKALDVNIDTWAKILVHHCSISTIYIGDTGQMELHSVNETQHLLPDHRTHS